MAYSSCIALTYGPSLTSRSAVETFADQAVIAIENARLFEAEQQRRTVESLEQQTATAEVLQVISSSPGELQPVFDVILDKAVRICRADTATLFLYENGTARRAARHSGVADATMSIVPSAKSGTMRSITTKQIIHIPDYLADPAYLEGDDYVVAGAERLGIRASLHVPMLREQEVVGAVTIWRKEASAFTEKQIDLIANFAAQAVIAMARAYSRSCASALPTLPSRWSSRRPPLACSRSLAAPRSISKPCSKL